MVLKKLLEKSCGPISKGEFVTIMDLATTDIKINRVDFGRRTSLVDAVGIAAICKTVLGR